MSFIVNVLTGAKEKMEGKKAKQILEKKGDENSGKICKGKNSLKCIIAFKITFRKEFIVYQQLLHCVSLLIFRTYFLFSL